MRLVQVLIPEGKSEAVLASLDERGIDFAVFPEIGRSGFEAMVQFPVPPSGVETVMESLTAVGLQEDSYTVVLPTETVVSRRLAALEERFPGLRISREELYARAQDLAPANSTFFAFLVLSTVIATTGLLLDSAATIIGAMVVAPLMGPAISASAGTVLDDQRMAGRGVKLQVAGLVAAVAVAAVIGWAVQQTILVPPDFELGSLAQIEERTSPNFLSLFLALGSGLAGALSVMRGSGSSLVGVAIAVALVPPAATSGLGLAFGYPTAALAGAVLVVVNLLAINVSALVLFYLSGFRPLETERHRGVRSSVLSRIGVIVLAIVVLSVVLGAVTWVSFEVESVTRETETAFEASFGEVADGDAVLLDVTVDYDAADLLLGEPPLVDALVGLPGGTDAPPGLARAFDERLTERTDRDVSVRIGFVEEQVSDTERTVASAGSATASPVSSRERGYGTAEPGRRPGHV